MMADTRVFPDKYLHESTPAAPIMSRVRALCRCDAHLVFAALPATLHAVGAKMCTVVHPGIGG